MDGVLSGKTALVTGASRGVGAAIARKLAASGAAVTVNYAKSRDAAEAVVAEIVRSGGIAYALHGDVSRPEDVTAMFRDVAKRGAPLDVLVNNAGVFAASPIEALTVDEFRRLYDTNVLGALMTVRAALPHFASAGGSIVNIGSLSGRMASPNQAAYAGTKAALDAITLSLSKELGSRRIRVNSLNPGAVETEGLAESSFMSDAMRARIVSLTPLGRLGRPDDIANAAVFLASDASSWVNGQLICMAGGLTY